MEDLLKQVERIVPLRRVLTILKIAEKEAGDGPLKWWNISFPQAVILRFGQRGLRPDVQPTLNGISFNPTLIIFNPNKFKASMTILSRVYDWIETFLNER